MATYTSPKSTLCVSGDEMLNKCPKSPSYSDDAEFEDMLFQNQKANGNYQSYLMEEVHEEPSGDQLKNVFDKIFANTKTPDVEQEILRVPKTQKVQDVLEIEDKKDGLLGNIIEYNISRGGLSQTPDKRSKLLGLDHTVPAPVFQPLPWQNKGTISDILREEEQDVKPLLLNKTDKIMLLEKSIPYEKDICSIHAFHFDDTLTNERIISSGPQLKLCNIQNPGRMQEYIQKPVDPVDTYVESVYNPVLPPKEQKLPPKMDFIPAHHSTPLEHSPQAYTSFSIEHERPKSSMDDKSTSFYDFSYDKPPFNYYADSILAKSTHPPYKTETPLPPTPVYPRYSPVPIQPNDSHRTLEHVAIPKNAQLNSPPRSRSPTSRYKQIIHKYKTQLSIPNDTPIPNLAYEHRYLDKNEYSDNYRQTTPYVPRSQNRTPRTPEPDFHIHTYTHKSTDTSASAKYSIIKTHTTPYYTEDLPSFSTNNNALYTYTPSKYTPSYTQNTNIWNKYY